VKSGRRKKELILIMDLRDTSADWTLFLDRDGVLNIEKNDDYILNWEEFQFYPTTLEALAILRPLFSRIFLVTNQKGVGRGLMSLADLEDIHSNMLEAIQSKGGGLDHLFFCTDLDSDSPNRKPNPGMAFQAKTLYPVVDFKKSIMVGNRPSDMAFGKNAGMHTVFVATTHPQTENPHSQIDYRFNNLLEFAQAVAALRKS
jgi:D-glycero-D-manno-heptose 1,7-bisphosphate phosphatase